MKAVKDIGERIAEIRKLYEQLEGVGLHEGIEAVANFRKVANDYVKTGAPVSGEFPIPQISRKLVYTLTTHKHVPCTIVLKCT